MNTPRERKRVVMRGLYPATLTPFNPDLSIDLPSLRSHLRTIAATPGVRGLVVNGGLGELLQLTLDEQVLVIQETLKQREPGQLLIAGLAANSAYRAVEEGRALKRAGAEALLVFPPFDVRAYRRLTTHTPAVVGFFRELGEKVDLPMIIFQYGPQSGCAYSVETLEALAELPSVVAIKATSGSLDAYRPVWDALRDKVSIMAAVDGPPLLDMLEYGAHGALVGISTIGTPVWVELVDATLARDRERARKVFARCAPIMARVWENHLPTRISSEVAATKEALVQLGQLPSSRVRAPAVDVSDAVRAEIRLGLSEAGLLRDSALAQA
ncbi:MAG: dihydrodipicolinate synthase [Ramlibacter sp.]|nr:dihydrodipicolinate synthase [Ramlibacter sp.]